MKRSILHIRIKDFELQAERLMDTRLRTRAVAVISSHQSNGTVRCASPEAQQEGIQPGMHVSLVRKMNHSTLLVPYNFTLYRRMHSHITTMLNYFSPLVEPNHYGQYFADMSGMERIFSSTQNVGYQMLKDINRQVQFQSQVGISANKLVSSITTKVIPEQIHEVANGSESRFMAPLYSALLPSLRDQSLGKLINFLLLKYVRDIQQLTADPQMSATLFGKFGRQIELEAHGKDFTAVHPQRSVPRIAVQEILKADTNDDDILTSKIRDMAEQLGFRLRQKHQTARILTVEIHYTDGFKNISKGSGLQHSDQDLAEQCILLFRKANYRRNRIRTILIEASQLQPAVRQLNLFDDREQNQNALTRALDHIRKRFGETSITFAAAM